MTCGDRHCRYDAAIRVDDDTLCEIHALRALERFLGGGRA